jgi:plastocyanin
MKKTIAAAAAFALSLALLASQAAPAAAPTARASGAKGVSISHFEFHPGTLVIGKGTKVTFANRSGVAHTATSGSFNTGRIKPGHSITVRFAQKGTFSYHCEIHPFMHGKIVVN